MLYEQEQTQPSANKKPGLHVPRCWYRSLGHQKLPASFGAIPTQLSVVLTFGSQKGSLNSEINTTEKGACYLGSKENKNQFNGKIF